MAAAEVLAFAASETYGWPPTQPSRRTTGPRIEGSCPRGGIDFQITWLKSRLSLIAEAWVGLRSSKHPTGFQTRKPKPIVVPDFCSPKWSRSHHQLPPSPYNSESPPSNLHEHTGMDSPVQRRRPDSNGCDGALPSNFGDQGRRRSDRDRELLADPNMALIDFHSDEGFLQAAGKKKKKQTTSFNWLDDEGGKKDGDGPDGGGDGNKDQKRGDSGPGDGADNSGGDGGDGGNHGDKNGQEVDDQDIWGEFATVDDKKKNKGKKTTTFDLPDIPSTSTDFHEIKLDDSGGGDSLDLGLGPKTEKVTSGLSAWTSSWTTGSWGWAGMGKHNEESKPFEGDKPKEPDHGDENPWSINRGKPQKTTKSTFTFGSSDQADETKDETIDFLGGSKPAKKDDAGFAWGASTTKTADDDFWGTFGNNKAADETTKESEKPAAPQEASDDIWGWSTTKKDKKKKNKVTIIEETLQEETLQEETSPDPAPDTPVNSKDPENGAKREAEAALIAQEEAELLKLQTKKDIGSKLTRKQEERHKVLTENAKARAEAAEAAAAETKTDKAEDQCAAESGDAIEATSDPLDDLVGNDDAVQAEADEKARIVKEEEEEMELLRSKKKLKKPEKDRLRILEANAEQRAWEAEEAALVAESKEQESPVPEEPAVPKESAVLKESAITGITDSSDTPLVEDSPAAGDAAKDEADEKARIIREEEEEIELLRLKKKLKRPEKDRLRILEANAEQRAWEAEEAAIAAESKEQESPVPEVIDNSDAPPAEDPAPPVAGDATQDEADKKAGIIREEEEEMAMLRGKKKLKKPDKERLWILEDRAAKRAQEAEEAENAAADQSVPDSGGDTGEYKIDETAPTSVDDAGGDALAEQDEAARLIVKEETELEMLLSKSKLKKPEKARLKELQDKKESREQEAAANAEAITETGRGSVDLPADDAPIDCQGANIGDAGKSEADELASKLIGEEEVELKLLLSKPKLKKPEKTRLKILQENKVTREQEAAEKAAAENTEAPSADAPIDNIPALDEPPVGGDSGEADNAAQKELEDALVAAEESELADLLAKSKPKKPEKTRLKELQERKDKREEEARLAEEEARLTQEKVEQEAQELEEQKKREEEERLAAEVAVEEAEIVSLKAKKKLKKPDKERLAELEARAQERASAEAERLAEELLEEDAANEEARKTDPEPTTTNGVSWADDDPSKDNGAGDDWMDDWMSSSKKSKKKGKEEPIPDPPAAEPETEKKVDEDDLWSSFGTNKKDKKKKGKNSTLIDFGAPDDSSAALDAPPTVTEEDGFDFGWGKSSKKDATTAANDIWDFGSGSKKKKPKNTPVEVVEDPIKPDVVEEVKDKVDNADLWSTFGVDKKSKDKKSREQALAAEPPPPAPTPPSMDLTETEIDYEAGNGWDDPSGSTELTKTKSKSSENDSKKSSKNKEPKISKKEQEKLEKEKKKAEQEQKAREEQEAKEAAERFRIEEEERLAAEAKAEEERLAREAEEQARKEEEKKQAALDAVAQEEADLMALQAKKDSGKKLTKKEKEKFDKLSASCQARADEKAAQEAAEQAIREEEQRLAREAEEQARKEATEREESELKELQKKKDLGRKLIKKDKEKYETLLANKKARDKAAKEAEAPRDDPALAGETKLDDDLEKDLANLDTNQLDELDQFLSTPAEPAAKAGDVDAFSFWGASKKKTSSKKVKGSLVAEPVSECTTPNFNPSTPNFHNTNIFCWRSSHSSLSAPAEIANAESSKLFEATTDDSAAVEDTKSKDAVVDAWSAWKDTFSTLPSKGANVVETETNHDPNTGISEPKTLSPLPPPMKDRKPVRGKIADRLKAFETVPPPPPAACADLFPPPPPPPPPAAPAAPAEQEAPPAEGVKKKKKSKAAVEIPGSFPIEEEELPDDILEVVDMSPPKSKKGSSKKSSKSKTEDAVPVPPPPPPPPAVPDAPMSPPPEPKKESRKERPKINRDGGSSWGMWTASTPRDKEKKSSSKSKYADEIKKDKKIRSHDKVEKLSAKESSSDKAERAKVKDKETPVRPKMMSVFASTPPISRSASTREKRHTSSKSSRRHSADITSGIISPPPEEAPEISAKAAKILGVGDGLSRSGSKRKKGSRAAEDEDIVMVGANDADLSPDKSSRRRSKQYPHDDDIVMVDAADATPTPAPPLRRSNTSASTRKGFSGLFGGILSTPRSEPRPEPRRRNTYHSTDVEDAGAMTDANAEARKAARRARKAEREAAGKAGEEARRAKDEARREKRRRQEEEAEAQRQGEREARRAERRAAKAREEEERRASQEKEAAREERRRQRHHQREREREGAAAAGETGAEDAEAEARRAPRERRKPRVVAESDREDDEERRRRRAEKRVAREAEGGPASHRRSEQDDFVLPHPSKLYRRHTDGLDKPSKKVDVNPPSWPYSGTSSWVKDHSDAGPPPDDGGLTSEAGDDDVDDTAVRRERRRRKRYGDGLGEFEVGAGDERRRRKRREERSEGSDERRRGYVGETRRSATFVDTPRSSAGSWWKKLTGS